MDGIHIHVVYPQRCVWVCNATVLGKDMERRTLEKEEEDALALWGALPRKRVRGSETGYEWKGKRRWAMPGRATRRKARRLALVDANTSLMCFI